MQLHWAAHVHHGIHRWKLDRYLVLDPFKRDSGCMISWIPKELLLDLAEYLLFGLPTGKSTTYEVGTYSQSQVWQGNTFVVCWRCLRRLCHPNIKQYGMFSSRLPLFICKGCSTQCLRNIRYTQRQLVNMMKDAHDKLLNKNQRLMNQWDEIGYGIRAWFTVDMKKHIRMYKLLNLLQE